MENPLLTEKQQSFKMLIPEYVEGKIRYALRRYPNKEWSGILFYTFDGSIESNDLVITCQDILPMNVGVAGYTQFEENASIIGYMVDNDLIDCQYGLIHSHHTMNTFFSPEDLNTLKVEGSERNNFVSLIVNNAGKYNAKITSKEVCKTIVNKHFTTYLFDKYFTKEESTKNESNSVCYYNLDIEYSTKSFDDLKSIFDELDKTAGQFSNNERSLWNDKKIVDSVVESLPVKNIPVGAKTAKELKLFDDDEVEHASYTIDKSVVEAAVAQLISGSITAVRLPPKDLEKTLSTIAERFDKRILNKAELEFVIGNHVTNVIESMIDHIPEDTIPYDVRMEALAMQCAITIDELHLDYPYINEILEDLEIYARNR